MMKTALRISHQNMVFHAKIKRRLLFECGLIQD
jgi:hypothetical protein